MSYTKAISILIVLTGSAYAGTLERGADLPLYYDVRTGNISVDMTDITGGIVTGYSFGIPFDGYLSENFTPFMDTLFINDRTDAIGESNFNGIEPGVYSLGNVLPAGLSEEGLTEYFGEHRHPQNTLFLYTAYGALGSLTYHQFEPNYAPSPFPPLNDSSIGPPPVDRWATEIELIYDASTGGLAIDATGENGGSFMAYQLFLSQNLVRTEAFEPITGSEPSVKPDSITEFAFASIDEGIYSIGEVLPPGLSQTEFINLIDSATFLGEPGHGAGALDIGANGNVMSLVHTVPEPSTFALVFVIMGLFVPIRKLRRRSS